MEDVSKLDLGAIYERLLQTMPPHEADQSIEWIRKIRELKIQKNVCILGHNYMTPDVFYGISDYVGDSLGLSRKAVETEADIILFNGVHFMAETAKILNPNRLVLIADLEAGCSLAESITAEDVQKLKREHPGTPVVTYINCTAAVKAETDVCCTSANALKIIESLLEQKIIFLPDEYLARNIRLKTKKEIISWEKGKCVVHEQYTAEDIADARRHFDDLVVISHPECNTDVTTASDFSGSTSQMENFIRNSGKTNIMLVTECSMGDNLRTVFPEKHFVTSCHTCPYMKLITLEKIYDSLLNEKFAVEVPEEIQIPARRALERMLELS